MNIVSRVEHAIQRLFGSCAADAAAASGVIQRQRVFTAITLARAFVLAFLRDPDASDKDVAEVATLAGAPVSPQAVEQRHTDRLADFFRRLFGHAAKEVVGSSKSMAPILDRFTAVVVVDSSTIALPDGQAGEFPGCGGSCGGGKAALKLQTEMDLKTGALTCVQVETGRSSDNASSRQQASRGPGSLRISDLGYFCLEVFAAMAVAHEHFLSRLQFGTHVFDGSGARLDLLRWLAQRGGPFVDEWVTIGAAERLRCRLIAWRLPAEQANRRRQKLRETLRRKKNREPSAERLAWCGWTILITSVPEAMLNPKEAVVLYRARWQIELLFKRWKSQGLVDQMTGSTEVRQMVKLWARLLAVLVLHWLVAPTAGGNPLVSWVKAGAAARGFVYRLLAALDKPEELAGVLADLARVVEKTCRRNKRAQPGTNELLVNCELLEYTLT